MNTESDLKLQALADSIIRYLRSGANPEDPGVMRAVLATASRLAMEDDDERAAQVLRAYRAAKWFEGVSA